MEQLGELDKGLRSSNIGDQCEAIVLFERLIRENSQNSVLLNASFLKLADFFRTGQNFTRFWILRVFLAIGEQTLQKALNIEEILRRINTVLQSNDPIARAIALRIFGSMPRITADKLHIHHGIRGSLDSHHQIEAEAAVFAIDQLCSNSGIFSEGIIEKLTSLLGTETPLNLKLKIIRIFRHMYHTPVTSFKAKQICMKMIENYPTKDFMMAIIDTLTHLSQRSIVDIPQQIEFLISIIKNDPRKQVQIISYKSLIILSSIAPHQNFHIEELLEISSNSSKEIKKYVLKLEKVLSPYFGNETKSKIIFICERFLHSNDDSLVKLSAEVLSIIFSHQFELKDSDQIIDRIVPTLLSIITHNLLSPNKNQESLEVLLNSLFKIAKNSSKNIYKVTDILLSLLLKVKESESLVICRYVARFLVCSRDPINSFSTRIINLLSKTLNHPSLSSSLSLCLFSSIHLQSELQSLTKINEIISEGSNWSLYLIARNSFCYGFHQISLQVFSTLSTKVDSESFHYWLKSLEILCNAQLFISKGSLTESTTHFYKALSSLKSSTSSLNKMNFPINFVRIRILFVDILLALKNFIEENEVFTESSQKSLNIDSPRTHSRATKLLSSLEDVLIQLKDLSSNSKMDLSSSLFIQDYQTLCDIMIHILNFSLNNQHSALLSLKNIHFREQTRNPMKEMNKQIVEKFEELLKENFSSTLILKSLQPMFEESSGYYPLCFFVNNVKGRLKSQSE